MAKRTFATIWQQIEKLYFSFKDGKKTRAELEQGVQDILDKPDVEKIILELGQLLMLDYEAFLDFDFKFKLAGDDPRFMRVSLYDSKKKIIYLDPVRVYEFIDLLRDAEKLQGAGADFEKYRKQSLMLELGKLPNKCILFMCILQQIAISGGYTHIGLSEIPQENLSDTALYQTLLWAFNELQKKLYILNGINIRTEFGITWHESDWINQ
jgi:hypothetical protein